MARKTTKNQIVKEVQKAMSELGTYKKEYNRMVDIYAGLLHQYQVFEDEFEKSGYKIEEEYTNKAGATNMRKVPLYGAMESIRKDIATYSDRLGLNPKSMESITAEKTSSSSLGKILSEI
ncbi:P27 family phage terminase small subunit [Microaceticoccus formicicus]|uniref:P27 family phage terminase small subunit n=1 Tax=Microaceticoccus formicicus TaxID=3118105 RepID=UPI003CD01B54|nr:P27 family phage terminase small subunit [Peptoniphilaceae bacterium AMB_02]